MVKKSHDFIHHYQQVGGGWEGGERGVGLMLNYQ